MKHWYRDTVFSHIAQPYYGPCHLPTQETRALRIEFIITKKDNLIVNNTIRTNKCISINSKNNKIQIKLTVL